jgi:hypothetical protein
MSTTHITEIVPDLDKMPKWAKEAFESGQFFVAALAKTAELQAKLDAAEKKLNHFVWAENNPSEYVTELEKAEATIERMAKVFKEADEYLNTHPETTIGHMSVFHSQFHELQKELKS